MESPQSHSTSPYAASDSSLAARPASLSGGVIAIAVISIVFAAIGLVSGAGQAASLALAKSMQSMQATAMQNQPAELRDAFMKFLKSQNAITDRFRPVTLLNSVLEIAISATLLVGAIGVLRRRDKGRRRLRFAYLCATLFVLWRLVPYALMQMQMQPAMETYLNEMMAAQGGPGPQQVGVNVAKASQFAGMAFFIGWTILELILMLVARAHLGKPAVIAQFTESR